MATTTRLYTPEILALAVSLADSPYDPALPLQGQARSAACGSTLLASLELGPFGRIARIGMKAQACAIGQASAALFLRSAAGRTVQDIAASRSAIAAWLGAAGPIPGWPELALLAPARDYPARHGAILLPWDAALDALSTA